MLGPPPIPRSRFTPVANENRYAPGGFALPPMLHDPMSDAPDLVARLILQTTGAVPT